MYTAEAPPPVDIGALPATTTVKGRLLEMAKLIGNLAAGPPTWKLGQSLEEAQRPPPPAPAPPMRVREITAPGELVVYAPPVKLVDCSPHKGKSVAHTAEVDAPTTSLNVPAVHAMQTADVVAADKRP